MSDFGENWCEEIAKAFEVNSTVLDRWLIDVKCQEEPCNLQTESLPQQNLPEHPPTQDNANITNVESTLIPPPNNNLPSTQSQNGDAPVQHRQQRKPRSTWSNEEHMLFLRGVQMYGMSWKRISKEIVRTKTPSQLASHAQKYFERQKMLPSSKKRKSIHDITLPLNVNPPHHVQAIAPPLNVDPPPAQVIVPPLNVDPPPAQVIVPHAPPTQDFSMQNINVPDIHPLVYDPALNFYIQNVSTANVDPAAYTPLQDISTKDIQGQQQMPPFTPPY